MHHLAHHLAHPRAHPRAHNGAPRGRGFSLVEMLIVIAVIVVLLSLLITGLNIATRASQSANSRVLMQSIRQSIIRFRDDIGYYPPVLDGERLGIRELARRGKVWALNGIVAPGHGVRPWLRAALGSSHLITVHNRTAFPHPMHLHGHPVRVLARNGEATPYPVWRDTLLVGPREQVRFAFVADNPGRWLFHCHIPEHMDAGMLGVVEVG